MHALLPTRLILSWLLGLGIVLHQTSASDVLDIVKVTKDVTRSLVKAWDLVNQNVDFDHAPIPILRNMEQNLFGRFERINSKLQDLDGRGYSRDIYLTTTILYSFPERVQHQLGLNHLQGFMSKIDKNFRWMQKYGIERTSYETVKMKEFARQVLSNDASSVVNLMERMHAFVVPLEANITNLGPFSLLANAMQETESNVLCSIRQSPQQVLYNLYYATALVELKGYTMVQFSYFLLRLYGKGNFTGEVWQSRKIYEKRTNEVVETAKKAMQNASREVWKCDPKKHKKGETYQEITNFLQGYVENEINLNNHGLCGRDCVEYTFAKSYEERPTCSGHVLGCNFIDADMWICDASESGRRYEYIEHANGRVLGRKLGCARNTTPMNSWSYMLFWSCSYCFCLCEEQGLQSDRYFNMRSVISDIHNNRVVTGLRFVKKNRVIHLQIQEGKLLPRMIINATTLNWKEPEDYKIDDGKMFDGQDYHTLTWKNRKMDLDDLEADDGYVLTGVRFKEIGTHLNFEIYITKFDFATGKLKPEYSKWKDNSNTDVGVSKNLRKEVKLDHPDVPTRTTFPSIPRSQSNQYIKFTHSDMDRDAAQTTVPFFDAQKVKSLEAVPLTGAGIFHKGRQFFGGFIAPKIITYDVIKYLTAVFPTEEVN